MDGYGKVGRSQGKSLQITKSQTQWTSWTSNTLWIKNNTCKPFSSLKCLEFLLYMYI